MSYLRLSIALATYNGAKYLPVQLDSLAKQTRLPDELVITDDGSKDETVEVCRAFAKTAPFEVIVHPLPRNVGAYQNFSSAAAMISGDVMFYCDQDDFWHADKLAKFEAVFEREPEAGLVMCNANLVTMDLQPMKRTLWDILNFNAALRIQSEGLDGFEVFTRSIAVFGCTTAVRTTHRGLYNPVPAPLPFDTWTGRIVAAVSPVRLIQESLQDYRQHATQTTGVNRRRGLARILHIVANSDAVAMEGDQAFLRQIESTLAECETSPRIERSLEVTRSRLRLLDSRLLARRSLVRRLPLVAGNLLSGRYRKSAKGLRSAMLDLIAPPQSFF